MSDVKQRLSFVKRAGQAAGMIGPTQDQLKALQDRAKLGLTLKSLAANHEWWAFERIYNVVREEMTQKVRKAANGDPQAISNALDGVDAIRESINRAIDEGVAAQEQLERIKTEEK